MRGRVRAHAPLFQFFLLTRTSRYAPDAFQLCQECKTGAGDVAYTLVVLVVGLLLLVGLNWALNKKVFKKNPKLKRSLKTGLKILFVSTQILAALPSIVPAIELPENYKEAVESVQVRKGGGWVGGGGRGGVARGANHPRSHHARFST